MIAKNGYKAAAYVDMNSKQDASTVLGTHGLRSKAISLTSTSSNGSSSGGGVWALKAELSRLQKQRNELLNATNTNTNTNTTTATTITTTINTNTTNSI